MSKAMLRLGDRGQRPRLQTRIFIACEPHDWVVSFLGPSLQQLNQVLKETL
jgi:hypothetical protein